MTIQEAITEAKAIVIQRAEMIEHALTIPFDLQSRIKRQAIRSEVKRLKIIYKTLALLQQPTRDEDI